MNPLTIFRNIRLFALGIIFVLTMASFSTIALGQSTPNKPLLIIKVENEGENLTRASGVSDITASELSSLRSALKQQLGETFTIIPESDERDCIELGVSIEKLRTQHQVLYLASSAIAVGKGKSDLLITHNVVIQPTLQKITAILTYQLSMMVLQSQLRGIPK